MSISVLNLFFSEVENEENDNWEDAKTKLKEFIMKFGGIALKPETAFAKVIASVNGDNHPDNNKKDDSPTKNADTNNKVATGSLKKDA